jgi:hypothetical protein
VAASEHHSACTGQITFKCCANDGGDANATIASKPSTKRNERVILMRLPPWRAELLSVGRIPTLRRQTVNIEHASVTRVQRGRT